jgi:dynein regulatory complex protein 1
MDDLLATKEKLIQDYSNEVKSKDDEYVKELKRQSEEIELLAERMNKQYMAFQVSFVDELELIEKAFVEERQELISKNYKDIESLMDNRRKNEG